MREEHAKTPQHSPDLPILIRVWLALTSIAPSLLVGVARQAHRRQEAAPERFAERLGQASLARPDGQLIWIHAASVGEATSAVRLARRLASRGAATILLTTNTATGAATVRRLLPQVLHQFVPIDSRQAVDRFFDYWRPDLALFIEGDLWPRMVLALEARACPMALLNVRASRSRRRFPSVYARLLCTMRFITVQEPCLIVDLRGLGLDPTRLHALGNLKADVALPAVDEDTKNMIAAAAVGRGIWAAVSTHKGEESLIIEAHARLTGNPLLVLVPRHPERGHAVAAELAKRGIAFTRHSTGARPDSNTRVHLVDVLGETGSVYSAAGLVFIGGSLFAGLGGHTPYEPAALGCAILSGPYVANFEAAFKSLEEAGAAYLVHNGALLGDAVDALLTQEERRKAMQLAAKHVYAVQGGGTDRTLDLLTALLPTPLA
ncbi:3-deoxy-D-manno-octulosonic acid transferase [Pseudorhodobacter ferrugineus]|uniref:3-deoxy-D-manno-octulosonic acid transferase n=1 Tax=Pseudorhodobacter ferrugineus TaxID=77008 RepID=UPI00040F4894|nr:glycosyltransferase N-terminal domain-containing protein [Pseudorhodobacter ferrugineus]